MLDDASFVLAPGHRYALIGRNGKGKSTLLRWLAARRVGNLPAEISIHYVSQEVQLSESDEGTLPVDVVLAAVSLRIPLARPRFEVLFPGSPQLNTQRCGRTGCGASHPAC